MITKDSFSLPKKQLVIVVIVSVFVSLIIGFIAGSAAFDLARYVHQNKFLQGLFPNENATSTNENLGGNQNLQDKNADIFSRDKQITKVVKDISPAVVSIIISKDLPKIEQYMIDPFQDSPLGDFFNLQIPQYRQNGTEKQEIGGGTGFVVGENGLILTNRHVVFDKEAEYTVLTNDGKKYDAKIVAISPLQDLAFLRVSGINIKPLKLGDSDKIEIGQTAITIGNALGEFRNTVSVGVISGLKRTITASQGFGGASEELDQVIQTDAAINEGNSGGPLLNLQGEVVGVNTAMASGAENIGFAIPVNEAKKNIADVISSGEISYPYLGVRYVLINKLIQEQNKLMVDYGALVVRGQSSTELAIMPGSPADKAGFQENDIILEMNGKKINETNSLSKMVLNAKIGDEVTLKVLSKGNTKEIKLKLEKMPSTL